MKNLLVQIKGTDNEIIITEREYNLIKDITQMLIIDADYQVKKIEIEVIKPELIEFDLIDEITKIEAIKEINPDFDEVQKEIVKKMEKKFPTKIQSPKTSKKSYKRKS
jgi:hypothetical protein